MVAKNKIKSLIELIENSEVNEIEISSFWGAQKIRVSQNSNTIHTTDISKQIQVQPAKEIQPTEVPVPKVPEPIKENPEDKKVEVSDNHHEITAPLVGTYYSSPKPEADDFVKIGDIISVGQVICIIEAMKIFNEIESEVAGKIIDIVPKSGTPIEFGQPIIVIEQK
ncbi:MAG: acetyl-CoA carboxylase biotin carboxyl carrier protein [Candidatus Marinimicrobia bacterium]|nr:acetyl-CoA carboxylase biotin carboxyl carrier protein [Candidatus Neomarinimicrobiota bacterium]MBL7023045.1 acetyl-CoA carboxylase biotin carboxyl carrier protein [Candidatus Neomarinimicrobiota bacterium]MBL7110146.1 acetyl-CoA carboxylase biotin carboxyl carrier protein [Candidatus Neomarinimicrobiota bacterium]